MQLFQPFAERLLPPIASISVVSDIWWMVTIIKRLVISLIAGGIGLVAAFQTSFHIGLLAVASSHDGQAGMSAFFGAVFIALAVGMMTVALVFRVSGKWL